MHELPFFTQHQNLGTWLLAAVIVLVLAFIAFAWDRQDLGDGLVMGSGGSSVSTVWDSAHAGVDDFLSGPAPRSGTAAR